MIYRKNPVGLGDVQYGSIEQMHLDMEREKTQHMTRLLINTLQLGVSIS